MTTWLSSQSVSHRACDAVTCIDSKCVTQQMLKIHRRFKLSYPAYGGHPPLGVCVCVGVCLFIIQPIFLLLHSSSLQRRKHLIQLFSHSFKPPPILDLRHTHKHTGEGKRPFPDRPKESITVVKVQIVMGCFCSHTTPLSNYRW